MNIFMFPGQGSQSRGMGAALFAEFNELTAIADKVLGYSIQELCCEDPRRELNKTQYTQPALFVVNALSYYKKIKDGHVGPDYLVGHSLGEFNALLAAGCISFEQGLQLVKKRGELMNTASDGGMAAVLNSNKQDIENILASNGLHNIDLANFNTPSQIVLSGPREDIDRAQSFFQNGTVRYVVLNTSGAFHSRLMQGIKEQFEAYIRGFKFMPPKIPVISNVTARPYESTSIIENLGRQLASGVQWCDSIQYLMAVAKQAEKTPNFIEVGHGNVLTSMFALIVKETTEEDMQNKLASFSLSAKPSNQPSQGTEIKPKTNKMQTASNQSLVSVGQNLGAPKKLTAQEKVLQWNEKYAIGICVKSTTLDYGELPTRTQAQVLFGHRAAIYIEGYNGYFDLDELVPLE